MTIKSVNTEPINYLEQSSEKLGHTYCLQIKKNDARISNRLRFIWSVIQPPVHHLWQETWSFFSANKSAMELILSKFVPFAGKTGIWMTMEFSQYTVADNKVKNNLRRSFKFYVCSLCLISK